MYTGQRPAAQCRLTEYLFRMSTEPRWISTVSHAVCGVQQRQQRLLPPWRSQHRPLATVSGSIPSPQITRRPLPHGACAVAAAAQSDMRRVGLCRKGAALAGLPQPRGDLHAGAAAVCDGLPADQRRACAAALCMRALQRGRGHGTRHARVRSRHRCLLPSVHQPNRCQPGV